ncbi:MAG: DUF192 domain-containing protein [Candidatus Shapirobacteria bacterium]|nr:DUF192 domain-containing protein [Candidatus Shapirobacteria bacterium]
MSKNLVIILIIIVLIPLIVFLFSKKNSTIKFSTTKIKLNNIEYEIEIAHTISQKSAGLSNRDKLCQTCGMIFIFNKDSIMPFWMKNTFIPLDIIWINSNGQITDIITATNINSTKILQNTQPAKYVLELNAFDAQKIGLNIGDTIQLPNLND